MLNKETNRRDKRVSVRFFSKIKSVEAPDYH